MVCWLSSCDSGALEYYLSSCGTWAYLSHGIEDLPKPGIEPVSHALAGGFLNTSPLGKSDFISILVSVQPSHFLWFLCAWFIPFTFSLFVILDLNFVSGKL